MRTIGKLGNLFLRGCQHLYYSPGITSEYSTGPLRRRMSSVVRNTKNTRRKWRLAVPVGVGLSMVMATQWKYLHKHGYPEDISNKSELLNDFMVTCYCCLPLRITSRIGGWLTSIDLPVNLRPTIYGFYANMFNVNQDEVELNLTSFPNLVEFFVRSLKQGVRPIAQNTNMVSPADGEVLYFGPVTSCRVEQVKGVTYDLRYFLGDLNKYSANGTGQDDYVKSLLKYPDSRLYQLIVYLAPGDYHRFHSPTDWNINFRRHFPGKLLSVNPTVLRYTPNLFSLNERVVYVGEWEGGFMAYAAVGATNVGSIRVYCDRELATNKTQWSEKSFRHDVTLNNTHMSKGELFGEFRLGSTIVLLFEAPRDFEFFLQTGQPTKVGQAVGACIIESVDDKEHVPQRNLIVNVAHDWRDIWKFKA